MVTVGVDTWGGLGIQRYLEVEFEGPFGRFGLAWGG